jgi:tetratricopeptide (TPR) repeat protein
MLTILLASLVAITALGSEGTDPVFLFLYRSVIFGIVVWCGRELYRNRSAFVSPRFAAAGAIGFLLMLSFLQYPSTFEGFYFWYQALLFGVLLVVFSAYAQTQTAAWKLRILYIIAGFQAFLILIRMRFVNPDYFASYLLIGFSICLSVALFRPARWERAVAATASAFFYYGIVQTTSRGATIAAFLVIVAAAVRYGERSRIARIAAVAAICVALAAAALISPRLITKFTDIHGSQNAYNYMRLGVWESTLHLIRDYPVFGVGLGQFVHVSKRFTPALTNGGVARYMQRPGIAHSEYLQYAAETGIPATLVLMALATCLIGLAIKRSKTCPADSRVVQEAAIITIAGLASHALVDNNWNVPVVAAAVVVFGLADVLPYGQWPLKMEWKPVETTMAAALALIIYAHSTVIPAVGLRFNQSGYNAFVVHDLDKAESDYRRAEAILPIHSALLDEMGMLYIARFQQTNNRQWIGAAKEYFARAIAASPNAEEPLRHVQNALILSLTGDAQTDSTIHPEIAAIDREILRVDPFDPFTRKNLAEALYRDGHQQEAKNQLQQALDYEPNYIPAYLTMAKWDTEAGDWEKASRYRLQAFEISRKYRDLQTTKPYELLLLGQPERLASH